MLPPNFKPHPPLPSAYPHLWINQCLIVQQLPQYMREQALLPEYYESLTKKFSQYLLTTDQIEWHSFELAISQFTPSDRI